MLFKIKIAEDEEIAEDLTGANGHARLIPDSPEEEDKKKKKKKKKKNEDDEEEDLAETANPRKTRGKNAHQAHRRVAADPVARHVAKQAGLRRQREKFVTQ